MNAEISQPSAPEPKSSRARSLIDRYAMGGPMLAYAVSGLSREQERLRPGPGDWSIAELVAHLMDTDLVDSDRMKRVIAEENPVLMGFDESAWVKRLGYQEASVEEAVSLLTANRRWTAAILRRLDDDAFARVGQHSETGRKSLAELLAIAVNHVDHHLRFLYVKRSNLGVGILPRYPSEAIPTTY
ncbi:MAG: DinB family protein [Isosphaeraceae bacterium]